MPSAYYHPASDRRRATALLLTLAAHVLLLLLLLKLGPAQLPPIVVKSDPKVFTMAPDSVPAAKPAPRSKTVAKVKTASGGASPRGPAPAAPPKSETPDPPKSPKPPPFKLLAGGMELFDAADISKMPSHRGEEVAGGDSDGAGVGKDSGAAYGPGEGPGGERLYNAEWYREPSNAELNGYLPPNGAPPGGYALIACRTVPNYQVENCRSLGESPIGSGLARAMRQAAWQFRVRPPRIGGRPVIGAWVRIRIDFTQGGVK